MTRTPAVLALLVLQACGSDGPAADLNGTWTRDIGDACAAAWRFDNPAYQVTVACGNADGTADAEAESGRYTYDGDELLLTPKRSTCPAHAAALESIRMQVSDDGERIAHNTGDTILVYSRHESSGSSSGGVTIRLGCFNSDGTFTQRPTVDL
jgi:hypothetical protein